MGNRLRCAALPVKLHIILHVTHAKVPEQSLPSPVFAFDGNQGSADLTAREIGDHTGAVGKPAQGVSHRAALIVDNKKVHVLRPEGNGKG